MFDKLGGIAKHTSNKLALQEKHRLFSDFNFSYFGKDHIALRKFDKSIKENDEIQLTMELYGKEILAHDHIYPDGVKSLSHLLRNKNDFFFKGKNVQAIEGITTLLREACRSAYSMDTLAIIKDKFVINTLSGRNAKVLQ